MTRARRISLWFLALLVGCGTLAAEDADPLRDEARAAHLQRLDDYLAADAAATARWFERDPVDLGGGSEGDGRLPDSLADPAYWEDLFRNSEWGDTFAGLTADDVIDVAATEVVADEKFAAAERALSPFYTIADGDYLVSTPARDGSPLSDGWFGVYRKIDGQWWLMATD